MARGPGHGATTFSRSTKTVGRRFEGRQAFHWQVAATESRGGRARGETASEREGASLSPRLEPFVSVLGEELEKLPGPLGENKASVSIKPGLIDSHAVSVWLIIVQGQGLS